MTAETVPLQQPHPTPHSPVQRAVVGLLHAADQMHRHMSTAMEPFGVTGQQYNVLRILRGAHPEPLPTLEIAGRMLEQTPGITRLLDRVEKKGLVSRERHPEDRRQVLCRVTPLGLELLEDMEKPVNTANETALDMLNAQELEELIRLLDTIRAGKE